MDVTGNGIVAGRVAAARKLGYHEVPVVELAHLSEAERRAHVIADNRLAELAGGIMAIELQALSDLKPDSPASSATPFQPWPKSASMARSTSSAWIGVTWMN